MYPRNAASPEPVAIGAVVQISDGAVQTSGCTVRIKPIGVAEGDGAGTTAYSTDGIVLYTPTQAETNYTSFILIAKKTGCIPACVTVVTTASSVPGRTMPADGSITAAVIATDAIDADAIKADAVTEIQAGLATPTNITAATGIVLSPVTHTGAVIPTVTTVTNGVTASTVSDKTGYSLTAGTGLGNQTSNITGSLSGSVGSISGVTFPSNFATLGINASGHVSRVTLVDTTTTNTDMRGTDNALLASGYTAPPSASTISSQVASDLAIAHGAGSWTTATGFSTLSQADIRTAVGLTTANLDTQIGNIQSDTNDIQTRLPASLESGRIAAALDSAAINAVADQVWDEAMSGHTTAGTYGGRIVRATNSNTEVQITGSMHIAADVHEFQAGVITAGDFAADSITASALASDAVTEIQNGLATSTALATESSKITNIADASGYMLAVLAGACADPQTASETYAITVFGSTFTVDMAGQTSTGTRTAPTLTKT